MNKERLTQLSEKLLEIPNMISSHQESVLNLNERSQTISNEINQIESAIKAEISAQTDENGKKVYSNAEAREAAFVEVSAQNTELNSKREELASIQRNSNMEKIRIEALGNEQRNIRSILYFFGAAEGEQL